MKTIYGIAGKIFQHSRPVRDALYKRFVKSFPCCACKKWWHVDPAHTGPHSHGKRGSDSLVIPLCRTCHTAFDRAPFKFAMSHGLNINELILTYQELYLLHFPERVVGTCEAVGMTEAVVAGEDEGR